MPLPLHKDSEFAAKYGNASALNIYRLILSIISQRTVNLNRLKTAFANYIQRDTGKAVQPDSCYKRIIRIFDECAEQEEILLDLAKLMFQIFSKLGFKTILIDGTKWEVKGTSVHYLVVSVMVKGVSIPLYFCDLEKAGASSQEERIALTKQILDCFNIEGSTIIGDREFVGETWFKFLKDKGLRFVIRARKGDYMQAFDATRANSYLFYFNKCQTQKKTLSRIFHLDGIAYRMIFVPNKSPSEEEPVIILITTLVDAKKAAEAYLTRWNIERMFKQLKSDGFNVEDMNLGTTKRRLLLLALTCIAYSLTIRCFFDEKAKSKRITRKDGTTHLVKSIFQDGLCRMTKHINDIKSFFKLLERVWKKPQNQPQL
jgi:hypothetical protein